MSTKISHSYELKTLNITKDIGVSGAAGTAGETTVSLIYSFKDLYLYHDIDQTVTSGEVIIQEQGNLVKVFPIMGWERIDIEFNPIDSSSGTYTSYKRSFFVYAVDEMRDEGDSKTYTIHFADLAALINVSSRVEHRYIGKAEKIISEICNADMFTKHGLKNSSSGSGPAIQLSSTTSTRFDMDFVSPCWKPFDFINKIASLAVSSSGTFSDCLFFQQTDGTYHFTDWQTLFSQSTVTFKKYPRSENIIKDKYVINDYTMRNLYNTQAQAMAGAFGVVAKIFDVSNMSIHTYTNYYYQGDVGADHGTYSAIGVEKLPEVNNIATPTYTNQLMAPYIRGNSGDPRFSAIKMSPVGCITVHGTGFSETDIARMAAAGNPNAGENSLGVSAETAQYAYANGHACNINMRAKSVVLTLNPCSDLKLGQLVTIKMAGNESEKTDIKTIDEFLNGIWFIGKIKYHLTFNEISVNVECYSTSLGLR